MSAKRQSSLLPNCHFSLQGTPRGTLLSLPAGQDKQLGSCSHVHAQGCVTRQQLLESVRPDTTLCHQGSESHNYLKSWTYMLAPSMVQTDSRRATIGAQDRSDSIDGMLLHCKGRHSPSEVRVTQPKAPEHYHASSTS